MSSAKKLYRVSVEVEMLVCAKDQKGAEGEARSNVRDAISEADYFAFPCEASYQFDDDYRPYGDDQNRTVTEILAAEESEP